MAVICRFEGVSDAVEDFLRWHDVWVPDFSFLLMKAGFPGWPQFRFPLSEFPQ